MVTESGSVGKLFANACGDELDNQDQDHQAPDKGANHRPAPAVEALHQRGADAAGTDNTEGGCILQVDVKTVDCGGDEACGELGDDTVADLLEGGAAHGIKTFQNVGIEIFNCSDVHL